MTFTTEQARLRSYASSYELGHGAIKHIFDGKVVVQEKIDGSQISFGVFNGELMIRSKNSTIYPENPPDLFQIAVDEIKQRADKLTPGWTYHGEYVGSLQHNTITYDRLPKGHIVLFDIDTGIEDYIPPKDVQPEAERLDFEPIKTLYWGMIRSADEVKAFLQHTPTLGGDIIEGVVIKNYWRWTAEKKFALAKYVQEQFKETHKVEWKKKNPGANDLVEQLTAELATEARWEKAIQHLRDAGQLTESPKDIGPLMKEIAVDIRKEEEEYIKQKLFDWAWPKIQRGTSRGFPQWYKDRLLESAFEDRSEEKELEEFHNELDEYSPER